MIRRIHSYSLSILICLLTFCTFLSFAQDSKRVPTIHLKSGDIVPEPNVSAWMSNTAAAKATDKPRQVLIQFSTLPDKAQRDILKANGVTLLDYIPDNTYTAIISQSLNAAKLTNVPMRAIVTMQPEWKVDVRLLGKTNNEKQNIEVLFSVCGDITTDEVKSFIAALGGSIAPDGIAKHGYYKATLPRAKLTELAEWYSIRYVNKSAVAIPTDKQSIPAVKGNSAIAPISYKGYSLNGEGVTIGIGDNTSGSFHTDTRDRTTNFNPGQLTNHGIHIGGITGGAAILDPLAQSMTPNVSMISFFFSSVLSATGDMLKDFNMTLTNNSYTVTENDCDYFGTYDLYSRFLDTLGVQYPVVQHVFAAGNDGELTCPPFAPGYGTMGGGYQPAKNNIVVGSVTHNLEQAWDQSRGPTRDGRMKPEIVAVGASVYSGLRNDTYGWAGGTSMASPQVVSGLTILTQRYKQLHGNTQPRGDILKTILLNGAMDLGNPGPDYSYGFGMMDIGRSLTILDSNRYDTGSVSTGTGKTFTFTIPASMAQAKVMLCWHDIPASPSSATQLINDLDLTVTTPTSITHLPLGLDKTVANIQDTAVEKPDHLNNVEQVTINNPTPGTYTIKVSGYNVPEGPQHFVIAYDMQPKSVSLTFPYSGVQLPNSDSLRVFWNAIPDGNTFSIDLSLDNGGVWIPLSNNTPASAHYFGVMPTSINSGNCRIRLRRNGTPQVAISERFVINQQPVAALSDSQCPGYVNIHWSPVANASEYLMLKKVGAHMKVIDTTTDTTYSFSGMSLQETSIVAVQPILDGLPGYRSLAISTVANSGDCSNPASVGDLTIESVDYPTDGRLLTSTAQGVTTTASVRLRNLYTTACGSYTISYRVNGAPWQTLISPGYTIPANSSINLSIPGFSFGTPGNYQLQLAITNTALPDPEPTNDTLVYTLKCIPNDPIDLTSPLTDDFESLPVFSVTHDSFDISPNHYWDFNSNDDSGRLRSFVYDNITIGGNRSISLDQKQAMHEGSRNRFTGTFNLSGYDTASHEVRVDFDYLIHGKPFNYDGNIVSARGVDTNGWMPFYNYNFDVYPGVIQSAKSISLTDLVRNSGSNFSTSTQISFGQNDSSLIATYNYGTGITFDNFKMYTVTNDAMIASIVSPQPNNCGLPAFVPLTVEVKNGVNTELHDIQIFYALDSGTVYSGSITAIPAKGSVNYTFPQELNIAAGSKHKLNVWLQSTGDTYPDNDSLLGYNFLNSKIITQFPYLENFEGGDGGFYADGYLSSWEYGTPNSVKINKAASGTKAWKSNLSGIYNNLEKSYLYTPCYDISGLNDPMLSFSMAEDIENCGGTLCDGAYMEYSFDGKDWSKLGTSGAGFNWYDSTFNIWNRAGFSRWHVSSIRLPKPPSGEVLHLRLALFSDPAVTMEGIAVDDIHIFDYKHPILPAKESIVITEDPATGQQNNYLTSAGVMTVIQPSQSIGSTTATLYAQETISNPSRTQYTLPRNYVIQSENNADDIFLSLFLPEADLLASVNDTNCASCTPVKDAYSLGVTSYYNDNNPKAENNTLTDDTGGEFTFTPSTQVQWVPYFDGYRADIHTSRLGEFWFNNGGPTHSMAAGVDYLNFLAFRSGDKATTFWHSLIDTAVASYTLERSYDNAAFVAVTQIDATHSIPGTYKYSEPVDFTATPVVYYRLKWTLTGSDTYYYSPVRKVSADAVPENLVQFNASMVTSNLIMVDWTSYIDGMTDHYVLERAIDNGSFQLMDNRIAANRYGQAYYYTDVPGSISTGTRLHYRLTAVLNDKSEIALPIRTVIWVNGGAATNIYPNPVSNNEFTILWNAEQGTEMKLNVIDLAGRTLYQSTTPATQWNNSTTLHTDNVPAGMYLVRIIIDGYRHTFKLVYE